MRYMSSDEIRDTWLKFFSDHGHYIEPSASLVPNNDPTLLWINAGVAALKKYFDGTLTPKHRRITNAQKCIRTNDIDNVGHTARHHTFFEMMGNFSIGDYFRNEVIPWAYELLTSEKYYGLDPHKLFVTYYPDDKETHDLWVKCGIPEENMVPSENNFWEIGEGPCGPDTEINYDRGEKYDPQHLGLKLLKDDLENDRYIELWNIVFSQFNSMPGVERKNYKQLPQKNIDTGAGLERLACIMQDTETNFETDLFMPYIKELESKAKYPYDEKHKLAYRVIADHIRSITFALADGAMFSNDGRGYVLKRLLRRASRYAQTIGLETGTLASLVPVVVKNMSHFYPYLTNNMDRNMKMILSEEKKFANTLKTGEKLLSQYLAKDDKVLSASDAFKLSDTYGFPFELTKEIALDYGKEVDEEGYNKLLKDAKELARSSRGERESFGIQSKDLIAFTTESEFIYNNEDIEGAVTGLFVNGSKVDSITEEGDIAFDKTNFYALSGGQVSDSGYIKNENCEAKVTDVSIANHSQHLLHVEVMYGEIKVGDKFIESVDWNKRNLIRKNHSATHLLQKALQEILSSDVHQEGAYYDDELLRFDINYDSKIDVDTLNAIEKRVNEKIFEALPVKTEILSKEDALKKNAMHLFSEKYSDKVRVVSMGDYSIEFCGGTHVSNTAEINSFAIVSEESVAAGIRRLTCYTGMKAYEFFKEKQGMILEASTLLKINSDKGVRNKIVSNNELISDLNNTIKNLREENTNSLMRELESQIYDFNSAKLLVTSLKNLTHEQEDSLAHKLTNKYSNLVLFLSVENGSKFDLVTSRGNAISIKAGDIMKEASKLLNGRGGGRGDIAFGGAEKVSSLSQVKDYIESLIK